MIVPERGGDGAPRRQVGRAEASSCGHLLAFSLPARALGQRKGQCQCVAPSGFVAAVNSGQT